MFVKTHFFSMKIVKLARNQSSIMVDKKYSQFETERLVLRATSSLDAPFILALMNTPLWIKHIGDRNVHSVQDAEKYIQDKMRPQQERLGFSNYTVIRKSDNAKLGTCGFYDREGLEGLDIGFAFLPEFHGQGYAYEAANRLMKFAIEESKIREIKAITIKENIASQKLLKKLGLEVKGTTKIPGDEEELLLYTFKS